LNSNLNFKKFFEVFSLSVLLGVGLKLDTAFATTQEFSGKSIVAISVECSDSQIKNDADLFFSQYRQKTYSGDLISKAIKKFYFRWPVYSISVFGEHFEDRVKLSLHLDVKTLVSEIVIRGNDAISSRSILEQIDIGKGERIFPDRLLRLKHRLTKYYEYRGFFQSQIKTYIEPQGDQKSGVLVVDIREGNPCYLTSIQFELLESPLSELKLRKLSRIKVNDRCDTNSIESGISRVTQKLRSNGYLAAQGIFQGLTLSKDMQEGSLSLRVFGGPKIKVEFKGNTFAFERNTLLEKAILLSEENQFNQGWLEATAKEGIRRFYRGQGYPRASVEAIDTLDVQNNLRTIRFEIKRGKKFRIGKVIFQGNSKLPSKKLLDQFWVASPEQIRSHVFVEEELSFSIKALFAFYQANGYLRARISDPLVTFKKEDNWADIVIKIEEGKQSILSSYRVIGNSVFNHQIIEEMMGAKKGQPIDPEWMRIQVQKIEDRYQVFGYKFAKITLPKIEEISEGLVVYEVKIEEGPEVRIGEISVRGNLETKEEVVRRELTILEGDHFNPEKIRESRRRLVRLGFFETVSIEELPFEPSKGTEDLVITIAERKKRSVKFRPGFSTDDGLRGSLELGYANIAGTGRSATASGRLNRQIHNADILEHRVVLTYLEPHLFNVVNGKIHFIDERNEEQQFDLDRRSFILGVDRELLSWLRSTLQWELEFRTPFNEQPGVVLSPFDQSAARFGSIATIVDVDKRNDPLNATKGTFHRIEFDVFNRSLLSDADFLQVFLRNSFYVPIYKRLRTVFSVRLGFSGTYGKTKDEGITEIPIEKRFRLGGNSNLRGFNRNCIGGLPSQAPENCSDVLLSQAPGGNSVFNYMFDLLIPLFNGFDLALFTDGGNAYLSNSDFDVFDIRTSAGVGLRYNTFFGPLRLDFGFVLDRRSGESLGELHFAVGQF